MASAKSSNTNEQIDRYLDGQPESKRTDMHALHTLVRKASPKGKLWFSDGRNSEGKVVSNPSIGYGSYTIKYADGTSREFYRIGLSANTSGISVYIMGLPDKTYLAKTYGKKIGKATLTGYCIKFKSFKDIDAAVLGEAIKYGLALKH